MQRKIIWSLIFVLIVGLSGFFFLKNNLNEIVREAIIFYGSELTKTTVKLEEVQINLKEGKAEFEDFILGNPASFQSKYALKFEEVKLDIDTSSIFDDNVIIEEITFDDVDIRYEKNKSTTNFDVIKNNTNSALSNLASAEIKNAPSSEIENESHAKKKFTIKRLVFSDAEVEVWLPLLGNKKIELDLPDIELRNIGLKQGGVSPEELTKILVEAIEKHLVTNIDLEQLESKIKKEVNRIKGQVDKIKKLENIEDIEGLEDIKDDVEDVIDNLEKLF